MAGRIRALYSEPSRGMTTLFLNIGLPAFCNRAASFGYRAEPEAGCINPFRVEEVLPGLDASPLKRVESSSYSIAIQRVFVAGQGDGIGSRWLRTSETFAC